MKHIFVVHSHITYLVALGVILKENLEKDNVLILSETFHLSYEPIAIQNVEIYKSYKYLLKDPLRIFYPNLDLDRTVDRFVGDDKFVAYVPVFHMIDRYLITHPRCERYNITEEGLAAYYTYYRGLQHTFLTGDRWRYSFGLQGIKERIEDIKKIIRGFSFSINAIPTFYTAYACDPNVTFYGFSEDSYYLAKERELVSFQDIEKAYKFTSLYNLDNSIIWISDPDILNLYKDKETFYEHIDRSFIAYLKQKRVSTVYIRFHYRESIEQKRDLCNFFHKRGIETIEIQKDVIMEIELLTAKNVSLFGIWSSLLVYGGMMGHKSYSIYDYLPIEIQSKSNVPQIKSFWKYIIRLK